MFDTYKRASESFLHMQQEVFKRWSQQWASTPLNVMDVSTDWAEKVQKRWLEFTTESLDRQRHSLDGMYKSLIQILDQAFRLSESKNPEDYRRTTDEVRHKMFEVFRAQSEAQFREFQRSAETWFDLLPKAEA
jgi:hypothetical protein